MAIISENNKKKWRGYISAQFLYAMTYVAITFFVLVALNVFCFRASRQLVFQSAKNSMTEKCLLASNEISALEILNSSTVSGIVSQMESLTVSRLIITDQSGISLYDTLQENTGKRILFPEVLTALDGNDVFVGSYRDGVVISHAAAPVYYYGTIIGCVYMSDQDSAQGGLIHLLQLTVFRITLILELVVIVFSLLYSRSFSSRMRKIMQSMRIIQEGDFTHRLRVGGNDELTVLGNEFNELTERLQTSEEKRRRFVSDASHELKTPLASIKLLTDSILQNEMDGDTIREFVGDIGNEADRLNRMTQKLLSMTRADSVPDTEAELTFMEPTLYRVYRMLEPMAQQADIQMELQVLKDCQILIREDDLYQIVFNLMENGIKYNRAGGTLSVLLEQIEDSAVLTIEDSGMGIPEDALEHIFERFYRVDKARSRATGGSGLGLAIVNAIIRSNNGQIQVASTLGQGTRFTVRFEVFETEVDSK